MRFGVLGPVVAWTDDGTEVPLTGSRQRALLAALLARPGDVVAGDRLADLLWGDEQPVHPGAALQSQVHRLRRTLTTAGPGWELETRDPGYRLLVERDLVDADRFGAALRRAREQLAGRPDRSVDELDAALALWRGPAYAGLADGEAARLEAIRLDQERLSAQELQGEALVRAGRPGTAVAVLEAFVALHPLREQPRAWLMRALYAMGRHAEALERYGDYQRHLAAELGLEPGAAIQQLQSRILRHELAADGTDGTDPADGTGGTGGTDSVPRRRGGGRSSPHGDAGQAGSLDRLRVRYLDTGGPSPVAVGTTGSGPPLLALPGWVSNLAVIGEGRDPRSSLLERLAKRTRLHLYDRAGTGLTRGEVADYGLDAGVAEMAAVVEQLSPPVSVLAMSQAGPVALALAARRPELVDRLVLFGTYADGTVFTNADLRASVVAMVRAHWGMGSQLIAGLYRPGASTEAADHLSRVLRDSAEREVAAGYLEAVYDARVTGELERVRAPSLVLHYRGDRVIPFRGAQQLAMGLPDARSVTLDGAYHLPDVADLDRIVAEIVAHLAGGTP